MSEREGDWKLCTLAIADGELKLNYGETEFFESIYYKVIDRGWDLSWKQEKNLTRIYNKLE